MNDDIIIYQNNAMKVPANLDVPELMQYNMQLKDREVEQILTTFNDKYYDMSAEYIWSRAISLLKDKIMDLGDEFIFEMLGRNDQMIGDELQPYEIIYIASELGFITKTERKRLESSNEFIQHYQSRDCDVAMDKSVASLIIISVMEAILSRDRETLGIEYNNFRDRLKLEIIDKDHELISIINNSPYFYKRTIIKTLLNLFKGTQDAEFDTVSTNMKTIIPMLWKDLLSDDRYPLGISYAETVNGGKKKMSHVLKSVLISVKGFDYVPESLRSNSFINIASQLRSAHFGMNNFYREPAIIKELSLLGTIIPGPALGSVLTSVLYVKLGNEYSVSHDAQKYADEILETITKDRWLYYMDNVFIAQEDLLYKVTNTNIVSRWNMLVQKYNLSEIEYMNPTVKQLMYASSSGNSGKVIREANKIKNKLINN